jgi:hydrogenase nickel incorporation protein HypA/HybF
MHEMTVASDLVRILVDAATRAGAARVTGARIRIGALSCINHDALRFGFQALSRDTLTVGATLELVTVPAKGDCPDCVWTGEVTSPGELDCPECGTGPVGLTGGQELTVESATIG